MKFESFDIYVQAPTLGSDKEYKGPHVLPGSPFKLLPRIFRLDIEALDGTRMIPPMSVSTSQRRWLRPLVPKANRATGRIRKVIVEVK